jgi:hypothetical protein
MLQEEFDYINFSEMAGELNRLEQAQRWAARFAEQRAQNRRIFNQMAFANARRRFEEDTVAVLFDEDEDDDKHSHKITRNWGKNGF